MQGAVAYTQTMQVSDPQRQAQHATYQPYGGGMAYGMAPPQIPSQSTGPVYEQASQYRQRPSGASETLSAQYGVPQAAQYYLAGQAGPTSAPAPELSAQQVPAQYQQAGYPQPGPPVPQPYPSTMTDPSQSGAYATYAQQAPYGTQQATPSVDQEFNTYRSRVRQIFAMVRDGALYDVGQHLMQISQYLLGNAEALGLTRDEDAAMRDERLQLWDEFNKVWLATMQRQFDMADEMSRTNQPIQEPQSIMNTQMLEQLSRELVRLCDIVEPKGLVDYQMGVAEEEIVELILRCLSQLEPASDGGGEATLAESSTSAALRDR
ncbi:hypothetical protein BAUCODRAFT_77809 [Baudoinia panamericana UAMH 10762]|uniref:Uncharacterized protein n=1 Tax=Baudoinia panamericana (strain UAMH 10762) TaxID=717646 RepID=M2LDZ5_BAUPA|nr:uncharacterized protein BAUCODRAFT_77809 [Baudoinia panamericana UAMH 10762]EMC92197.1 hypothetical protein BAUCODRAFT_77809 [Baudoinia panamericana UAMH 10762]